MAKKKGNKKKKRDDLKKIILNSMKSNLRNEQLKDELYRHTTEKTFKDKTKYDRKNQKPPEDDE